MQKLNRRHEPERRVTATAVIKHFDVFEEVRRGVLVRSVARGMHSLVLQAVEEAFRRRVDAPMSIDTRRIGQISQDERVQLPDDVALQAAMDFLVRHAFLRPAFDIRPGPRIAAHPYHGNGP